MKKLLLIEGNIGYKRFMETKYFEQLVAVAEKLLGPGGCPWDQKQTFFSLEPYLLEETHELIEAIDQNNALKILEELGDVFYSLVFIAKLGEKEEMFSLDQALEKVTEKLIRRHPHVFGDLPISSDEEIVHNWEEIKKKEGKTSPISDIPPTLPSLSRAQKIIHKLRGKKEPLVEEALDSGIGQKIWDLVKEADSQGEDAESLLRRVCLKYEEKFEKSRR